MEVKIYVVVALVMLIGAAWGQTTSSFQCYACAGTSASSSNNNCGQSVNPSATGVLTTPCSSGVCMKTVSTYNGVTSYTRSCGAAGTTNSCQSQDGAKICVYSCTSSLCNSADSTARVAIPLLIISTIVIAVLRGFN